MDKILNLEDEDVAKIVTRYLINKEHFKTAKALMTEAKLSTLKIAN